LLEEHTNGGSTPNLTYMLGLSVLGQTNPSGTTSYLLPDAQGSTRLVTDASGNITARLAYDAFGNPLGLALGVLNAPTTIILYTGQRFDISLMQYYLRARYYNTASGRFNELDPQFGTLQMPISLHKYLYVGNDPINSFDPTGMYSADFGYEAEEVIQNVYKVDHPGDIVLYGGWTKLAGRAFRLKPDIFNTTKFRWADIKPLTLRGIAHAGVTFKLYSDVLSLFGYSPDATWVPLTNYGVAGTMPFVFFNAGGIIFYTDVIDSLKELVVLSSLAAVRAFIASAAGQRLLQGILGALRDRIPGLVGTGLAGDEARLGDQVGLGGILASMGFL